MLQATVWSVNALKDYLKQYISIWSHMWKKNTLA